MEAGGKGRTVGMEEIENHVYKRNFLMVVHYRNTVL